MMWRKIKLEFTTFHNFLFSFLPVYFISYEFKDKKKLTSAAKNYLDSNKGGTSSLGVSLQWN